MEDKLLDLFEQINVMKNLPRSGWLLRGITNVESIADHSFGVAFISLILGEYLESKYNKKIDKEKLLTIAILHDIGEAVITDIPVPSLEIIGDKSEMEAKAFNHLLNNFDFKDKFVKLWNEFENRSSLEGIIVRIADKLDMMIQATNYEKNGSQNLDSFWNFAEQNPDFKYEWIKEIVDELFKRHNIDLNNN